MDKNQAMARRRESLEEQGGGLVADGATMERVQTQFQTAVRVQVPRNLEPIKKSALQEFAMGGEEMFYAWDIGGKNPKHIEDISIGGALVLHRLWGNCAYDVNLEQDSRKAWLLKAIWVDLESGASFPRLYLKTKTAAVGKYTDQRAMDMQFGDGQSRAIRNAILAGIPRWLQKQCLESAKAGLAHSVSEDRNAGAKVVEAFQEQFGIGKEQLEAHVDRKFDHWTPDHIAILVALGKAIKDGQTSVDEVFAPPEPPEREPGQEG